MFSFSSMQMSLSAIFPAVLPIKPFQVRKAQWSINCVSYPMKFVCKVSVFILTASNLHISNMAFDKATVLTRHQ